MHEHGLGGKARPRASPGASTHPFRGRAGCLRWLRVSPAGAGVLVSRPLHRTTQHLTCFGQNCQDQRAHTALGLARCPLDPGHGLQG
jgi:hypothetical protein